MSAALERFITALGADEHPEILRFPPVIDQRVVQRNGYFIGFPHLAGCIHSFTGSAADHKRLLYKLLSDAPSGDEFAQTGCMLTPAACYPVYPLIAARGGIAPEGVLVDVESYCFRREPSDNPMRMQSFRMREYVRIGTKAQVQSFFEAWMQRADDVMAAIGLTGRLAPAHDPFFGSAAASLAAGQIDGGLKFEMLVERSSAAHPVTQDPVAQDPVACMSFNRHETHFTASWDLRFRDGTLARSACVGFGMERLVLALYAQHGPDTQDWPAHVRGALWPAQ